MPHENHEPVVYYLASKAYPGCIKIGTTVNIHKRLPRMQKQKPNWDLYYLTYELGDESLERQRFQQFQHLRIAGDWYYKAPELVEHMAKCEAIR